LSIYLLIVKKGKKVEEEKVEDTSVKPTRPIGTYIYYSTATVPKIKASEGIAHKDAMAKVGKLWADLSDEAKKPFVKMHEEDVAR
jgi:HMG (high mobility group) box